MWRRRGLHREELAQNDLSNWVTAVQTSLPAGNGVVAVTPMAPADVYTVSVSWREPGEDQNFTYRASLEMIPVRP